MTTYKVTARRWELGWELHIERIGVTQAATPTSARRMVNDYVTAVTGADPGKIAIDYRIELDDELSAEIEAAREASREAERLQREAATRWRAIARLPIQEPRSAQPRFSYDTHRSGLGWDNSPVDSRIDSGSRAGEGLSSPRPEPTVYRRACGRRIMIVWRGISLSPSGCCSTDQLSRCLLPVPTQAASGLGR